MNIGASVVIKGSITASEDLAIAGRVEGDVLLHAGKLILAPGSQVSGDIHVPALVVDGSIDGNVTATERVDLRPGSFVAGSVTAATLVVVEGAQMNCRVEMPAGARPQPSPSPILA